jgi:membrane-bound metal-dependent hydrolase YbcI (DUF457 family)
MKVPEHVAFSFLLAQFGVQQQFGWTGTAFVIAAGCLPDLDGIGIIGGWRFYQRYHRILGHGLPMTLLGPLFLAVLATAIFDLPLLPMWGWLQVSLIFHLLTDVGFYNWPVQLIWPISKRGWAIGLLSWNDLIPTAFLYGGASLAILLPDKAPWIAAISMMATAGYLAWRALRREENSGWEAWLAGGWAERSPRFCRWLTGDFVT